MSSKSVASITIDLIIVVFALCIFFFTTPSFAQAPTVSPPSPPPKCPPLQACVALLPFLGKIGVGIQQAQPCCSIIGGLVEADAVACVCEVVKANVVGININIPVKEVLKVCEQNVPSFSQCS
ncbi:lipid transfer protein EARLI 1-like [Vicia villosa]|uniref:lipid transfer protein EARLI 1-like n=1 Tax=Vicia villosa TaxID=3911 RepID=UPI00273BAA0F|nr:lipid transfer protein EARLI 1-like [Vicia villosa]